MLEAAPVVEIMNQLHNLSYPCTDRHVKSLHDVLPFCLVDGKSAARRTTSFTMLQAFCRISSLQGEERKSFRCVQLLYIGSEASWLLGELFEVGTALCGRRVWTSNVPILETYDCLPSPEQQSLGVSAPNVDRDGHFQGCAFQGCNSLLILTQTSCWASMSNFVRYLA